MNTKDATALITSQSAEPRKASLATERPTLPPLATISPLEYVRAFTEERRGRPEAEGQLTSPR